MLSWVDDSSVSIEVDLNHAWQWKNLSPRISSLLTWVTYPTDKPTNMKVMIKQLCDEK